MVESVTMYRTEGGKTFSDEIAAHKYEYVAKMRDIIVGMFPDRSELDSGDFYQLSWVMIDNAKAKLVVMLKEQFGDDKMFAKAIDAFAKDSRNNIVGRLLCDSDSPLYGAWIIFESIDDKNRLFNQPYFVHSSVNWSRTNHPDEQGKQIPFD